MSTGNVKRVRTTRVGGFALPPGQVSRFWQALRSRDVLTRLGLCIVAGAIMWAATVKTDRLSIRRDNRSCSLARIRG